MNDIIDHVFGEQSYNPGPLRLHKMLTDIHDNADDPEKLQTIARADIGVFLYSLMYLSKHTRSKALKVLANGLSTTMVYSRFALEGEPTDDLVLTVNISQKKKG
jgi:hypothetical protein